MAQQNHNPNQHNPNQNVSNPLPHVPRQFGRVPYKPLDFQFLGGRPHHDLPQQPSKWLPKFNGDGTTIPSEHINKFYNALTINQVENHEDMFMKLFS